MNLPNKLTVARFIMAFAFVGLMSFPNLACYVAAYALFVCAALTDYYDGKIARARNLVTNFGKLLDPVADKVLVLGAFLMLMSLPRLHIPAWTIVIILAREFLITGARSLAASTGAVIPANLWGKTKAVIQMVYVLIFLALVIIGDLLELLAKSAPGWLKAVEWYWAVLRPVSMYAFVFVALFTLYSGIQFMRSNWKALDLGGQL